MLAEKCVVKYKWSESQKTRILMLIAVKLLCDLAQASSPLRASVS